MLEYAICDPIEYTITTVHLSQFDTASPAKLEYLSGPHNSMLALSEPQASAPSEPTISTSQPAATGHPMWHLYNLNSDCGCFEFSVCSSLSALSSVGTFSSADDVSTCSSAAETPESSVEAPFRSRALFVENVDTNKSVARAGTRNCGCAVTYKNTSMAPVIQMKAL